MNLWSCDLYWSYEPYVGNCLPCNVDPRPPVVCDVQSRKIQSGAAWTHIPDKRDLPIMHLYSQVVHLTTGHASTTVTEMRPPDLNLETGTTLTTPFSTPAHMNCVRYSVCVCLCVVLLPLCCCPYRKAGCLDLSSSGSDSECWSYLTESQVCMIVHSPCQPEPPPWSDTIHNQSMFIIIIIIVRCKRAFFWRLMMEN